MSKVLVISGHPDLDSSYTNSVILQQLEAGLDNVEVRRLDALYPDYQIDVDAEQQALVAADVVVLQFPFYWYSMPALMKKWLDDVFSFNFAYGAKGDKLKGKELFLSTTVGGPAESYDPLGYNHFTVEELLRPLQQTAYLAGMQFQPPIYTNGMVYIPNVYNELDEVQAKAREHAARLIEKITQVTDSADNRIRKFVAQWFEKFDALPEETEFFTGHLATDVNWVMPEGEFKGHEGFRDWYAIACGVFKPGCDHQVEQVVVKSAGGRHRAELRIRLIAETYPDSPLEGVSLNMLVNEVWELSLDEKGQVCLHDYRAVPVESE